MSATRLLAETLLRTHPADAAALLEHLPASSAADLFAGLPAQLAASVVTCMEPRQAEAVLSSMGAESAARVVGALPPAVAAALLRRAPSALGEAWLALLPPDTAQRLRAASTYAEGSAAALADLQALALPGDVAAARVLRRIREAPGSVRAYVYVLDRTQHLAGAVSLRELLLAEADVSLDALREARLEMLAAHADAAEIVAHPAWRALRSLPVVDADGIFLGAVHDETRRRLVREMAHASGAHTMLGMMLAVGEAYWVGVAGLLDGIVAAIGQAAPPPRSPS